MHTSTHAVQYRLSTTKLRKCLLISDKDSLPHLFCCRQLVKSMYLLHPNHSCNSLPQDRSRACFYFPPHLAIVDYETPLDFNPSPPPFLHSVPGVEVGNSVGVKITACFRYFDGSTDTLGGSRPALPRCQNLVSARQD